MRDPPPSCMSGRTEQAEEAKEETVSLQRGLQGRAVPITACLPIPRTVKADGIVLPSFFGYWLRPVPRSRFSFNRCQGLWCQDRKGLSSLNCCCLTACSSKCHRGSAQANLCLSLLMGTMIYSFLPKDEYQMGPII